VQVSCDAIRRTISYGTVLPSRGSPLSQLGDAELDVLVVGAGISGACIALEAATNGLRVGVVDRGDYGGGATGNCLRIVHGGLRYLQHADLRRARISTAERSMWLRSAPHLVEPLPVVVPTLRGRFPPRWMLAGALAVNDALGADRNDGLDADRQLPGARVLSRAECLTMVPALDHPHVTGGALFHDAVMYSPERLTLEVIEAAVRAGAAAANHVAFDEARRTRDGPVTCRLRDMITGDVAEVRTRWIVNATGAWVGDVARRITGRPAAEPPSYSIAFSLVTGEPDSGPAFAVSGGAPDPDRVGGSGARQLFVLPWRGQRLYGTAHFPFHGDPAAPVLPDTLVEQFLEELDAATPRLSLTPTAIRLVPWGLLPVAGPATERVRLLKHHRIVDHSTEGASHVLSVVSVKFTTARRLAADVVDRIIGRRVERAAPIRLALPGRLPEDVTASLASARAQHGPDVPDDVLEHLLRSYGTRHVDVIALARNVDGGLERVAEGAPVIRAQLHYGARFEQARTVDDLAWRRTELGPRGLVTDDVQRQAQRAIEAAAGRAGAVTRAP
jgi:glycerol-3-phosphate dehydrogenase